MSVDVGFRPANPGDLAELSLVTERANAYRDDMTLPVVLDNTESLVAVRTRMNRFEAWTHAAVCGDKIVGFALSHPLVDPENPTGGTDTEHLSFLMIEPDFWGKRIASRLIDITTGHARESGKSHLTLWTRKARNAHAQAFYAHKGFQLTGVERPNELGEQVQYKLNL